MFYFHSRVESVKARKVHLEVWRVQVSDGLRNKINTSPSSAPFSVRKSFSRKKSYDGSWKQNSDNVLLFVFYLSFSFRFILLSNVTYVLINLFFFFLKYLVYIIKYGFSGYLLHFKMRNSIGSNYFFLLKRRCFTVRNYRSGLITKASHYF